MFRTALFALATCIAAPAAALCTGQGYDDNLTPDQIIQLDQMITDMPYETGIAWEFTKDDKTLTLVGTVHIKDQRLNPLRDALSTRVAAADLLMVEVTPDEELEMTSAFAADPSLYLITDGPTLPDLLAPQAWADVSAAARDRQLPPFMVAQFQPWYLSLTLGIPPCAIAEIAAGERGLDHMLMEDAQAAGVPLAKLEEWETLIAVLADGSQAEQLEMLKLSIIPTDLMTQSIVTLLNDYFAQNTARLIAMSRITAASLTGLPEDEATALVDDMLGQLLVQRNLNWMPVIADAVAAHDNIVIAVGAAHLPGDDGMIALLADAGWTPTRLMLP